MRVVNVAVAQMGPIQRADSREAVVRRMLALMDEAKGKRAKAREICDFLAGLTDGMIVRTYRRLFDPEFVSFRDLG